MFEQSRRSLMLRGMGLASLCVAPAAAARLPGAGLSDDADEVLPLWPGTPPGGEGVVLVGETEDKPDHAGRRNRRLRRIGTPVLVVRRPPQPNGAAVMVVPGGGYSVLNYDTGGMDHAEWLNAAGVTAFILVYRLPGEGWSHRADVPLQDAQRAIRLIRANAGRWGVSPDRVGVLGSSAGGHLAGSLATRFDQQVYDPVDGNDTIPARPDLAALLFPVVTMAEGAHVPSRNELLGPGSAEPQRAAYSLERLVTQDTPPMFLCCAADDKVVAPANSLMLHRSMLDAGRAAELHVFQKGGHGFGTRLPGSVPTAHWPEVLLRFARFNGLMA